MTTTRTIKTKAAVATARGQHGDSCGFLAAVSGSTAAAAQQKGGGNGVAVAGRWRWASRQQGGGNSVAAAGQWRWAARQQRGGDSVAAAMQRRHDCPKDRQCGIALFLVPLLAMPPKNKGAAEQWQWRA